MSDWLFDLGNSRFKFAPLCGNRVGSVQAWKHGAEAADAAMLSALPQGQIAYIASVAAPALTARVLGNLRTRFAEVHIAHTRASYAGVRIGYAQPARLGVDRFLALLGARDTAPVVVAGVGTALTIDLLDGNGQHLGGRIAASPTTMRQALHARAPQLPEQGGTYGELANDTADALASGCDGAALALIERSLAHAQHLLQGSVRLLLHGGGGAALLPCLPAAEHRAALVLDGLAIWATHPSSP